jgi:hypothetical protein
MSGSQFDLEKLDSYLQGTLSADEIIALEFALAHDKELVDRLEMQRLINEMIVDRGVLDLKAKLKKGHHNGRHNKGEFGSLGLIALLVGAGIYVSIFISNNLTNKIVGYNSIKDTINDGKRPTSIASDIKQSAKSEEHHISAKNIQIDKSTLDNQVSDTLANNVMLTPFPSVSDNEPTSISSPGIRENEIIQQKPLENITQDQIPKDSLASDKIMNSKAIISKDYIIQPSLGQIWEIPLSEYETGEMKLFDPNGIQVLDIKVGNGGMQEWNGANHNGPVASGNYVYIITLSDSRILQGNVTVVR